MNVLQPDRPPVTTEQAAAFLAETFGAEGALSLLPSERDRVFLVRRPEGDLVLKIAGPSEDPGYIDLQVQALLHLERVAPELPLPRVLPSLAGRACEAYPGGGRARLLSFLPGRQMREAASTPALLRDLGGFLARLDRGLAGFFHPAGRQPLLWDPRQAAGLLPLTRHLEPAERALVGELVAAAERQVLPALAGLRAQVIHMDATLDNCLVDPAAPERICGLFDFGDMMHNALVVEPAVCAAELMVQGGDPLTVLGEVVLGYDLVQPLQAAELDLVFDLVLLRLAAGMTILAARSALNGEDEGAYHAAVRQALDGLMTEGRERATARLRAVCGFPEGTAAPAGNRSLMARREAVTLPGYEHFYDEALHLVAGQGVHLFDGAGRRYIDAYNNVPHVGHCHPRVVNAVSRQMARLNINTRYLYGSLVDYAERLVATLPEGLDRCLFVSSGSEANDIAWRMAWAASGNRGALVTAGAYHGVTELVGSLSPCGIVRGEAPPAFLRCIEAPYALRMGGSARAGEIALASLDAALASLAEAGLAPAGLMLDLALTSNGILPLPEGYLQAAVAKVRAAGGLFVADEVQAGFGRCGESFWRFQQEGVVPDIVTMAKAVGNGFPLAVVVTSEAVARAFSERYSFFSSCGGNPVACAAGLAVLDCMEREGLQENARTVGARLKQGLAAAVAGDPRIAEVRGQGLMIGVEATDGGRTGGVRPDAALAKRLVEGLRREGVLVGKEGPEGNVVKVRPPLVIAAEEADVLVERFARVLADAR